jgi:hypothetical protein
MSGLPIVFILLIVVVMILSRRGERNTKSAEVVDQFIEVEKRRLERSQKMLTAYRLFLQDMEKRFEGSESVTTTEYFGQYCPSYEKQFRHNSLGLAVFRDESDDQFTVHFLIYSEPDKADYAYWDISCGPVPKEKSDELLRIIYSPNADQQVAEFGMSSIHVDKKSIYADPEYVQLLQRSGVSLVLYGEYPVAEFVGGLDVAPEQNKERIEILLGNIVSAVKDGKLFKKEQ